MSNQIFKSKVPRELFYNFLDSVSSKNDKYYIFNKNSYKKGVFNGIINSFLEELVEYYHISKRKYIERKLTYTSFTTIIRQVCNLLKIEYTYKIKYDKSSYEIEYYICF